MRFAFGAAVRRPAPTRMLSRSLVLSELRVDPPPLPRQRRNLPRQTLLLSNKAESIIEAANQGARSWTPFHYALFFGGLHKSEGAVEAMKRNEGLVIEVRESWSSVAAPDAPLGGQWSARRAAELSASCRAG
jgi:hypothetical protein